MASDNVPLDDIAFHPNDMTALDPAAPIRSLLVNAAADTDPAAPHGPLDAAVPLHPVLQLDFPADERIASQEALDALCLIALGLVGLTVLGSAVGGRRGRDAEPVRAGAHPRVRRAASTGLRGSGLRSVLAWEAGLLALYATVPSLALGVGYGALTIRAVPEFDTVTLPYGRRRHPAERAAPGAWRTFASNRCS